MTARMGVAPVLTDDHLRALYQAHLDGASIRGLGRQIQERMGFASAHSAAAAISLGFHRLDFAARDRIEATRRASTTHGQAPRKGRRKDYKRWLRRQRGQAPRYCAGVKVTAPGAGRACRALALSDSDYCRGHDPRYAQARARELAAVRARIGAAA